MPYEKPVIYDKINTAFTYLDEGSELFKVVNVEMQDSLEDYVALAADTVKNQKEYFTGPMANDIYQFLPSPGYPLLIFPIQSPGKRIMLSL